MKKITPIIQVKTQHFLNISAYNYKDFSTILVLQKSIDISSVDESIHVWQYQTEGALFQRQPPFVWYWKLSDDILSGEDRKESVIAIRKMMGQMWAK